MAVRHDDASLGDDEVERHDLDLRERADDGIADGHRRDDEYRDDAEGAAVDWVGLGPPPPDCCRWPEI